MGGEWCFVGCYPEAPWEDPGDQAAGPSQRLGGSGQLWAAAATAEAAVTFGVPGIPSAAANLPSGREPAPPCEGETHLCARGERPGGDERGLGQTEPLRPGPRGAATPSTPAASAGDAAVTWARARSLASRALPDPRASRPPLGPGT